MRFATGLVGSLLVILAGAPVPAAAALQSAAALNVRSPANNATVHGLDLIVSGTAEPGIGILVCVGDGARPTAVNDTDADATTGAFSLIATLAPQVGEQLITVEALSRPLPDKCPELSLPGLAGVTRTVTVPVGAIQSVEVPSNHLVLKTPQFFVNGSTKHGSTPFLGVRVCLVGPDQEQFPLDWQTLNPSQTFFGFSETLRQAHAPAVRGDYTLIIQTVPLSDPPVLDCDLTSTRVPITVRTISYRPDATPPVIRPGISGMQGRDGWYTSDVTVTWSVSDPSSALVSQSGCESAVIGNDTPGMVLTCNATSIGGSATRSVTIKRDTHAPITSIQLAPETAPAPGTPLRTVEGLAIVKDARGTVVGTMQSVTCYFAPALKASLSGVDHANGSGIASLTYAASGAQKIAPTTVAGLGASASNIISTPGATTVTAWSRDAAGLRSENLVANFVISDSISCAGVALGVVLPGHGNLEVFGQVMDGATVQPFHQSISF